MKRCTVFLKRLLPILMFGVTLALFCVLTTVPISTQEPYPPRVLHFEQTIAVASFNGPNSTMDSCRLMLAESNDQFNKLELIHRLGTQYAVESTDFPTMMAVINQCQRIQDSELEDYDSEDEEDEDLEYFKLLKGILPGTLWCGYDDLAPNFYSLGASRRLDSCCRSHDHCPLKVKAFQRRYGVLNLHPYTKVHCSCDKAFYDCLKSVGTKKSEAVGNFFFNFAKLQCLKDVTEDDCSTERRKKSLFRRGRGCQEGIRMLPVERAKRF